MTPIMSTADSTTITRTITRLPQKRVLTMVNKYRVTIHLVKRLFLITKLAHCVRITNIILLIVTTIYAESTDDTAESSDDSGDNEESGETSEQGESFMPEVTCLHRVT